MANVGDIREQVERGRIQMETAAEYSGLTHDTASTRMSAASLSLTLGELITRVTRFRHDDVYGVPSLRQMVARAERSADDGCQLFVTAFSEGDGGNPRAAGIQSSALQASSESTNVRTGLDAIDTVLGEVLAALTIANEKLGQYEERREDLAGIAQRAARHAADADIAAQQYLNGL